MKTLQQTVEQAQSQLERLEERQFDSIDFDWEGIRFHATAKSSINGKPVIHLKAVIGSLFYTVEDGKARSRAISGIYKNNRGIDGSYKLLRSGEVHFESMTRTDDLLRGTDLMSALTLILLEAEPHLLEMRSNLKPIG